MPQHDTKATERHLAAIAYAIISEPYTPRAGTLAASYLAYPASLLSDDCESGDVTSDYTDILDHCRDGYTL